MFWSRGLLHLNKMFNFQSVTKSFYSPSKHRLSEIVKKNYAENYLESLTKLTHPLCRTSLEKFETQIRNDRRRNDLVLDIGCGDGSATVQILKPFLGSDVALESSDVSESMINHAVAKNGDRGVKFFVWNVLDEKPVKNMANRYDQVYSFLCLHYCQDLRKALTNIHDIIKPGGTLFFTMALKLPYYEAFKKLSRYSAWAPYLDEHRISQYSAPLQFEDDPEISCRKLMSTCGFSDVKIEFAVGEVPIETWEQFAGIAKFGDRFMDKLPEELQEQYFNDYLDEMKSLDNYINEKTDEEGKKFIEYKEKFYKSILCYGIKSN